MIFFTLMLIPLVIALVTFLMGKHKVIWQEFLAQVAVQSLIAGISVAIVHCNNTSDTEVWNGRVTKKYSEKVSCEHDYCCQTCQSCSTDSKGHTSCHSYCCRTCYDHPFDVDWNYVTSDNGKNDISRIDRQGLKEPPRWTAVIVGEPSSSTHSYVNYVKAAPDTLFKAQGMVERYKGSIPGYPQNVYDYYRLDRLVSVGLNVVESKRWNNLLSEYNAQLGASKEVNMIVILVKNQSHEYFNALEQQYLGGKKNDAILVISVDDANTIQWVDVMAWTDNKAFMVFTRDAVKDLGTIDLSNPDQVLSIFAANVNQHYQRKSMEDFKYLEESITPSAAQWIITMLIGILAAIGMSYFFYTNDIEDWKGKNSWQRGSRF